jgi:endo-1,4-beta-xylanase
MPSPIPTANPTLAIPSLNAVTRPSSEAMLTNIASFSSKMHSQYTGDDFVIGFDKENTPRVIAVYNEEKNEWAWKDIGLKDLADQVGLELGVVIDAVLFEIAPYLDILKRDFNLIVLDRWVYWGEFEPYKGEQNFDGLSSELDIAISLGTDIIVRGHPLLWYQSVPSWYGNQNKDELTMIMKEHVSSLVSHYNSTITEWIVVNEPYRKDDIFLNTIGAEYIDIAFQTARDANPSATLILNDWDNETSRGIHTQQTKEIVIRLKSKGLIDGVGLQMHLNGAYPPDKSDLVNTMQSYGVPVYITELDVDMSNVSGTQEERFVQQAKIFRGVLEACLTSGVCKSYTMWGIGDKYSWLEWLLNRPNADGTIYDDNLNPKPAYYALLKVIAQETGATPEHKAP